MADLGLLEKMGRELKCPICMSLLESAVSLPCNHFFCKNCISQSMKSSSGCPVCKVPYRPREVRSAPHMDNMVNIYKNMEVASGVNIFVTQPVPKKDGLTDEGGQPSKGTRARKRKGKNLKRRLPQSSETANQEVADSQTSEQLSFPAKKRVHVPLNPPFGIEKQSVKASAMEKLGKNSNNFTGCIELSRSVKEKPSFDEKGNPVFHPFFWLREENEDSQAEDLSADTLENDIPVYYPERIIPSFSDIKDSDDDVPTKLSPSVGLDTENKLAGFYDSEMFDWTQRPSSPELFSTPMKRKESQKLKMISEDAKASDVGVIDILHQPAMDMVASDSEDVSKMPEYDQNNITIGISKRQKRLMQHNDESKAKPNKRTMTRILDTGTNNLGKTTTVTEQSLARDNNQVDSAVLKCQGKTDDIAFQVEGEGSGTGKKAGMKIRSRGGKTALKDSVVQGAVRASLNGDYRKGEKLSKKLVTASGNESSEEKARLIEYETDGTCYNGLAQSGNRISKKSRSQEKSMKDQIVGSASPNHDATTGQASSEQIKAKSMQCKNSEALMKKCQSMNLQVSCAFCNSHDVSEVYGEMVHYLEGKPVAYASNEGKNLIHSHKNCTEWAPNVYFQEDSAINLQAEISRSRRIACNCCGIKGAALGCYNKSCRKSFHVPCARMIPQCRWDEENFVMLCPLHGTMKLPNEETLPSETNRNKPQPKITQFQMNNPWNWPSGSSKRWVLCCSGLTAEGKKTVSKFAKVAGVSMAKTWSSAVTHVIASTNEHGECKRTLKFLMAILEGIWVVKIDWINACLTSKEPVSEEKYEITADVHGIKRGPKTGRMRVLKKEPKLFNGFKFHFIGDFRPSFKGYLNELVLTGGGVIIQRKPIISAEKEPSPSDTTTLIIYSTELPEKSNDKEATVVLDHRKKEAQNLAGGSRAKVAAHTWILDSIAAGKIQKIL